MFVLIFLMVIGGSIFLTIVKSPRISVKNTDNLEELKTKLKEIDQNEKVREYLSKFGKEVRFKKPSDLKYYGAPAEKYFHNSYPEIDETFSKIDKLKESVWGDFTRAYESEVYQLVLTLSSHRQDGVIEILPENIESFLKTVSSIYDILCHKEKEVQAEEEKERLEWVKFGEEANSKVNRTMDLIKEDIKAESRDDLEKKDFPKITRGTSKANYNGQYRRVDTYTIKMEVEKILDFNNKIGFVVRVCEPPSSTGFEIILKKNGKVIKINSTLEEIESCSHIFQKNILRMANDEELTLLHEGEVVLENKFNINKFHPDVLRWEMSRHRELFEISNPTITGIYNETSTTSGFTYEGNDGEEGLLYKLSKNFHTIDANDWNIDPDDLTTVSLCVH